MEERKLEGMRYSRKVQLSNLDPELTWARIKDFVSAAGKVTRVDLHKDDRGKSKGSATIEYECQLEALRAYQQLEGIELAGRKVSIREEVEIDRPKSRSPRRKRFSSPGRREEGWQVYVGNLQYSITWQQLKEAFRGFGTILRVDVPKNRDARSRGYGFITFECEEDAITAVEKMHDTDLSGRKLTVRLQSRHSH